MLEVQEQRSQMEDQVCVSLTVSLPVSLSVSLSLRLSVCLSVCRFQSWSVSISRSLGRLWEDFGSKGRLHNNSVSARGG